jgi:hypothetical protein
MRMRKIFWTTILVATLVMAYAAGGVAAKPSKATFSLPEQAKKVAPAVYYLGKTLHKGRVAEGYAFVDYKKAHGKPTGCNNDGKCQGWEDASCSDCTGGGNGEDPGATCYGFLAKGAKWKSVEPYIVNPDTPGLSSGFVINNLASDIQKWEDAVGVDILGAGSSTNDILVADTESMDDRNEVYFADIAEDRAIGVTIVWGYFSGRPSWRELLEWDQVYDDADYDWSNSGEAGKMDFESIATHELGHSVGMDDLYTNECSEQTMYGYADNGETNKRTLEAGDITGITELYK